MMTGRKRVTALVLCVLMAALPVTSSALMGEHNGHHHCQKTHCPVCEQIALVTMIIRYILILSAAVLILPALKQAVHSGRHCASILQGALTPVAYKVRMNN